MIVVGVTWVFLTRPKLETYTFIKSSVSVFDTQYNAKVKSIRYNNIDNEILLKKFYNKSFIIYKASCGGTTQQNRIVERKHQHTLDITRALLFQA